jgi:putative tricarboxylic transport membrane protein
MAEHANDIVAADPAAPARGSPAIAHTRKVEIIVLLLLLAFAALMAYDNWRTGMGWASDGPRAGYFPFYLSVILGAACLYGLAALLLNRNDAQDVFVTREQFRRVLQVFFPTCLFCLLTQWLGLYAASFLLVAGFMRLSGRIAWWKSLVTSLIFTVVMFVTFELAFDVIMPKGPLEALFGH